jgi:hypothetical protein
MQQKDSSPGGPRELTGPWRWLAGAIAALLTLAVVGGFAYIRLASRAQNDQAVGSVSVGGVGFSCRLPVLAATSGAFISFPDGAVTIDQSLALSPYKGGYGNGYTYDAPVKKWVPVPRSSLSPDGRSYSYLAQTTGVPGETATLSLHTREIAGGKDRVLWEGSGSPMGPNQLTWLPTGIYFSAVLVPAGGQFQKGFNFPAIYVADPSHPGAPRRVGPNPEPQPPSPGQPNYYGPDMFTLVGGGAAWGTGNRVQTEAPTPNKPPAPGTYGPDKVLRMDLRDGTVSTYYTVTGVEMLSLVGLDQLGHPLVSLYPPKPSFENGPPPTSYMPPPPHLMLVTGPNQTVDLAAGADFHQGSQPMADSHGIWFGSWNSVWLYTQSGGLRQVATIPTGLFPSPSPPPGFEAKPNPPAGKPGMPAYMQGTLIMPAGSCA